MVKCEHGIEECSLEGNINLACSRAWRLPEHAKHYIFSPEYLAKHVMTKQGANMNTMLQEWRD